MSARRVEPARAWAWIVKGWRLFIKSPGLWIGMILIYFIINLALSFIPLVGFIANSLITPALMGGMIYGAAALDQGRDLEVSHLFRAFQDRERLGLMLTLGAIFLMISILAAIVIGLFMTGGMMMDGPMMGPHRGPGMGPFALLILWLTGLVIASTMLYAIPLVMLAGAAPLQAVRDSISACVLNILPFLILVLIYTVLALLAAFTFGLGFLVLGPVTFGAVYASYQEVFGEPAAPPIEQS